MPSSLVFPPGFRFGTSTSAFQIEGATDADGRGVSIWDVFAAEPGRVLGGDSPAVGIDHYHRYAEDVALLAQLGVQDYRFSFAWPRILPTGRGTVEKRGLDFYDRLIDALLTAGINPVPTLYHWDLPLALQEAGGWMARETAEAFADYASLLGEHFADRVTDWLTLNEMSVHTLYGHGLSEHAPGLGLELAALPAAHYQLLAHGLAVQRLRAAGAQRIGVANQHFPVIPASDDDADLIAAHVFADLTNWTFADPILRGVYPSDEIAGGILQLTGMSPEQLAADLRVISEPLDIYGVNYYEPTRIGAPQADRDSSGVLEVDIPEGLPFAAVPIEGVERTDFGWSIVPSGLGDILRQLRERYPELPPIIITENGASFSGGPGADGRVRDERRIRFLDAHLRALSDEMAAGANVVGYYVWSILDNFEWAAGFSERFGLVHVDLDTLARTPKDSYYWYRDLIEAQSPARSV